MGDEKSNPGFSVGDVVSLKSGGPKMTVEVVKEGGATCSWFAKDHTLQRAVFPFPTLDLAA